jgi:RNA polymerase sigma factor (sigma-70 family)
MKRAYETHWGKEIFLDRKVAIFYHGILRVPANRHERSSMDRSITSLTLLESLRDAADQGAWQRFDDCYRPLVVKFARQLGLWPHDAEEAGQRTMAAFCEAYRNNRYDRQKGRFKNWLLGIAQHKIADLRAEKLRQPLTPAERSSLEAVLANIRDPESMTAVWEQQWTDHMICLCLAQTRNQFASRDIRIFECLTIHGQTPEQVADTVNVPVKTVYNVKHRVLACMRAVGRELELSI